MNLLFGQDRAVAHWVAEHIPHLRQRIPYFPPGEVFGQASAIGVTNDAGEIVAGVVYHNYDPFTGNIEISCAAATPRWGNRAIFRALLRYVWRQVGCVRCTAVTPRKATSTRRFLEGLGFKREGSIRRGFRDDSAIVYGLLREEWEDGRFCRPRGRVDGQEHPAGAAAA